MSGGHLDFHRKKLMNFPDNDCEKYSLRSQLERAGDWRITTTIKKVSGRKNSNRLFSMDQEEGERKLIAISIYFDGKKLQSVKVYSFSVATVR